MFKRSQKHVSDSSKHWYQDKYQHVLVQRNMLALIALVALAAALIAVFAVMRLAPLKTVEPYLLQIDPKTGITQKVDPITREQYAASEAVDRYFSSLYIRARESYNPSILRYNNNIVRLMSLRNIYSEFNRSMSTNNPQSLTVLLGTVGQRDVYIRSMSYLKNPVTNKNKDEVTPEKIMRARVTTVDTMPNSSPTTQQWEVTITFQYANLSLDEQDQLINPLGFTVLSYQIQREIN